MIYVRKYYSATGASVVFLACRQLTAKKAGDAPPSVRQVAAEYRLNPVAVSRACQERVDEEFRENRRGIGMYVTESASNGGQS